MRERKEMTKIKEVLFRPATLDAVDNLDAALFTGDEFIGEGKLAIGARAALRGMLERWLKRIDEEELINTPAMKDYTIAVFEDGSAAWCGTEGALYDQKVSSETALIRFEVKLDVDALRGERDRVNELNKRAQSGDIIKG
jgi:hypothetical protein